MAVDLSRVYLAHVIRNLHVLLEAPSWLLSGRLWG
jgi:hypothetical protein